jgi:hypothetical protein
MSFKIFNTEHFTIENDDIIFKSAGKELNRISFNEINYAEIKRSAYSKNWIILLILGICMISFSGLFLIDAFSNLKSVILGSTFIAKRDSFTFFISYLTLFIFGIWFIITSFRKDIYLIIHLKSGQKRVSIKNLISNRKISKLIAIIEQKINLKIHINKEKYL